MEDKPYKTIDEQIETLASRGVEIVSRESSRRILISRGYYPLVNGYKDLFLDKDPSHQGQEDKYIEGTMFPSFETAMILDDLVRSVLYEYMMKSEQIMKNAIIQAFCSEYGGGESYLNEDWPRPRKGYRGNTSHYYENLGKLLSTLRRRRNNDRKKDYIAHYRQNNKEVPLWVLSPCLTFGEVATFYDFLNDRVQTKACKLIIEVSHNDKLSPKKLKNCFRVLTPFRNICAHYERVYCARVGPNKQYKVKDVLPAVALIMGEQAERNLASSIKRCFDSLGPQTEHIPSAMLSEMGLEYVRLAELSNQL